DLTTACSGSSRYERRSPRRRSVRRGRRTAQRCRCLSHSQQPTQGEPAPQGSVSHGGKVMHAYPARRDRKARGHFISARVRSSRHGTLSRCLHRGEGSCMAASETVSCRTTLVIPIRDTHLHGGSRESTL